MIMRERGWRSQPLEALFMLGNLHNHKSPLASRLNKTPKGKIKLLPFLSGIHVFVVSVEVFIVL